MTRVLVLIDGFNLYHAIKDLNAPELKWLDVSKLAQRFMRPGTERAISTRYFTAYPKWDKARTGRHRLYVAALKSIGVRVVLGDFQKIKRRCRTCGQYYETFEEKKTDANMVAQIMGEAAEDSFDTALIVSADSDLIAAVDGLRSYFPKKRLGFIFPPGHSSFHLKQRADFVRQATTHDLRTSLLPDSVILASGATIVRPPTWETTTARHKPGSN